MIHNHIQKPVVFFDLETTGVDIAKDRIVSIYLKKIEPSGRIVESGCYYVNPQMPIPIEASNVHGITDEKVKDALTFDKIAKPIHDFIEGCDLAGFNIVYFDIPLLAEEFARCDMSFPSPEAKFYDSCTVFKMKERRTLGAGYKFYCGKELTDAHDARADVNATFEILPKQMEMYGMTLDDVAKMSKPDTRVDLAGKIMLDKDGDPIYTFGKSRGVKIKNDPTFGTWMLSQSFVTLDTKRHIRRIFKELNEKHTS